MECEQKDEPSGSVVLMEPNGVCLESGSEAPGLGMLGSSSWRRQGKEELLMGGAGEAVRVTGPLLGCVCVWLWVSGCVCRARLAAVGR